MQVVRSAVLSLMVIAVPALAQSDPNAKYDRTGLMTAYKDPASGIELRIAEDRYRVTAVAADGKTLWSRADYKDAVVVLPGQSAPPERRARIANFRQLPSGEAGRLETEFARRRGMKGPILYVDYSASCCGGAQGLISLLDGKIENTGFN